MLDVKIDRQEPTDLFEQVAAEIRRAIADGEAKPGERLPPPRDLAAVLGVNTNTVLRSLPREHGHKVFTIRATLKTHPMGYIAGPRLGDRITCRLADVTVTLVVPVHRAHTFSPVGSARSLKLEVDRTRDGRVWVMCDMKNSHQNEARTARTRWSARSCVLGRANSAASRAPCVLDSHSTIAPGQRVVIPQRVLRPAV